MKSNENILPDLKELGGLILGFLPWLIFLFLSGRTIASLERATIISLVACPVFSYRELKQRFILQWGTLFFFSFCLGASYDSLGCAKRCKAEFFV